MTGTLAAIFRKEFLEAIRDRRVLLSSLVFGPVFAPLLFIGVLTLSVKHAVTSADESVMVTVAGANHAPHLVQFLRQQGNGQRHPQHQQTKRKQQTMLLHKWHIISARHMRKGSDRSRTSRCDYLTTQHVGEA